MKSKLSWCAQSFLILDDVASMHVVLPSNINERKKHNLIKDIEGFFSSMFWERDFFLTLVNACVVRDKTVWFHFVIFRPYEVRAFHFIM